MAQKIAVFIARILVVLFCVLMAAVLVWATLQMVYGIIQLVCNIKEALNGD